jgi:hypothetical protein
MNFNGSFFMVLPLLLVSSDSEASFFSLSSWFVDSVGFFAEPSFSIGLKNRFIVTGSKLKAHSHRKPKTPFTHAYSK